MRSTFFYSKIYNALFPTSFSITKSRQVSPARIAILLSQKDGAIRARQAKAVLNHPTNFPHTPLTNHTLPSRSVRRRRSAKHGRRKPLAHSKEIESRKYAHTIIFDLYSKLYTKTIFRCGRLLSGSENHSIMEIYCSQLLRSLSALVLLIAVTPSPTVHTIKVSM